MRAASYTAPVGLLSVRTKVERVGASDIEGSLTLSGKITALVLPELSLAQICRGKFCNGWARAATPTEKLTGFEGLNKNSGGFTVTPLPEGAPETFAYRDGDVPGFAVRAICTLVREPGLTDRLVGLI